MADITIKEEQVRYMRNRFVEAVTRLEEISDELQRLRDELNAVTDTLGRTLPEDTQPKE
jgi:uncharacterized coiled-coil DUF342 family protein